LATSFGVLALAIVEFFRPEHDDHIHHSTLPIAEQDAAFGV
jgi:hypothetical protein